MFSFLKKNKIKSIQVNDLDENLTEIKLIDIREPYETKAGSIKGSKNIPMGDLLEKPENYLNKQDEYYIMCQSGMRSARTVGMLSNLGYKVINVSGGMGSYIGTKIK